MALTTNTQTKSMGIVNQSNGKVVTDAAVAAATTFTLGFVPRIFRWINATSTAAHKEDEVHEGMAAGASLRTMAAATTPASSQTTLVADGPVINSDGTVTVPAALIPASSTFYWEAIG